VVNGLTQGAITDALGGQAGRTVIHAQ